MSGHFLRAEEAPGAGQEQASVTMKLLGDTQSGPSVAQSVKTEPLVTLL